MKTTAILLPSLLLVGLCVSAQQRLSVGVEMSEDPTGRYPTSKLYVASVDNNSAKPESFEVLQMPGGFVGSGTFFNCSIQQWDSKRRNWLTFRRTSTEEYPASTVAAIEVKPGEAKEACRAMLPHEGAHEGACVRFAVRTNVKEAGTVYVSAPFKVGAQPDRGDCRRKEK